VIFYLAANKAILYMPMEEKKLMNLPPQSKFWHRVHFHNGTVPSQFSDGLDDV
jgi:hypothetical protein